MRFAATWMNLEIITQSEADNKRKNIIMSLFVESKR